MKCEVCHKENPEGSNFCMSCGAKLDERNRCPACGTVGPDGAEYCYKCGSPMDSLVCPVCGNRCDVDAESCPMCRYRLRKAPRTDKTLSQTDETVETDLRGKPEIKPAATAKKSVAEKYLRPAATASALGAAAVALLFTFFMGTQNDLFALMLDGSTRTDIFYYLFGCYANPVSDYTLLTPMIVATMISAAALISVTAVSIAAIVKCSKKLKGAENNGEKLALAAYALFLYFSLLLKSTVSISAVNNGIDASAALNPATRFAIVVGFMAVIGYAALSAVARGKSFLSFSSIMNAAFGCGILLFSLIILSLLSGNALTVTTAGSSSAVKFGFARATAAARNIFDLEAADVEAVAFPAIFAALVNYASVALTVTIAMKCVESIASAKPLPRSFTIAAVVLTAAVAVLTGVSAGILVAAIKEVSETAVTVSAAPPFVAAVLAVLTLIANIVRANIEKRKAPDKNTAASD